VNILLTGGAGYIGSHTVVVSLDNFAMGGYLSEYDIVRFEDTYGRAPVVEIVSNPVIASEAR